MRAGSLRALFLAAAGMFSSAAATVPLQPSVETLRIREALREDQALLSFEVPEAGAGELRSTAATRVTVHTKTQSRVYPVPPASELQSAITLFVGLIVNRAGAEAPAAARLYRDLLDLPMSRLPPEVTRLVVVSEGTLQFFPFGALRKTERSEPIASRYTISRAPSAADWLHWRQFRPDIADRPALALMDPKLDPLVEPSYARLPRANRGARTVLDRAGADSLVRTDALASESLLKTTALNGFGVVHIASHATVNELDPDRSALLLAAGSPGEDGMLYVPEVEKLDLEGRIVILSGCATAAGSVVPGKGVRSLARACLTAGAHAVIGTVWPVEDNEIGNLLDDFYRHLETGRDLEEALALAIGDRMRAGEPTAAWAGVVVLGDGSLVRFPGGRRPRSPNSWGRSLVAAISVGTVAALATCVRRSRSARLARS